MPQSPSNEQKVGKLSEPAPGGASRCAAAQEPQGPGLPPPAPISSPPLLPLPTTIGSPLAVPPAARRCRLASGRRLPGLKRQSKSGVVDFTDWMFSRPEFLRWSELYGPFTVDAACDTDGRNAHVLPTFYSPSTSFLSADVAGQTVWMFPPSSHASAFLEHYYACKARAPATSAVILLPKWKSASWLPLHPRLTLVHEYPAGSDIFTRPSASDPLVRESVGPSPWPLQVFYDPPMSSDAFEASERLLAHVSATSNPRLNPSTAPIAAPLSSPSPSPPHSTTSPPPPISSPPPIPPPPPSLSAVPSILEAATSLLSSASSLLQPLFSLFSAVTPDPPTVPPPVPPDPPPPSSIATLSSPFSESLIVFNGTIKGRRARILVDSGAAKDFISTRFAKDLHLPLLPSPSSLQVRQANGQLTTSRHHTTTSFSVADYTESRTFISTPLTFCDVILGKPWLTHHNPSIDWTANTVTLSPTVTLFGTPPPPQPPPRLHLLSASQMAKHLRKPNTVTTFIATLTSLAEAAAPDASFPPPPDELHPVTDQSPSWTARLHSLMAAFAPTFSEPTNLPPPRPHDHHIDLEPGSRPPQQRTYRMSPAELQEVLRQLEDYLSKGWIVPSKSPFGAPILFARKKDGTLRMCVDYRALNAITVKNRYPLPRIDELLDQLQGSTIFTSLDLWSGYHQVRIHPDDVHKTAFRTRYGHFEFTVLPFGLTNAPATFMNLMNDVLSPFLDKFVVVYIDDILIYSKSPEDHLHHLQQVLSVLSANDLHVKLKKCTFGRTSTEFLGHIVSADGVKVDPKKVAAVAAWPVPTTITEVRAFLGFLNHYRRFIPHFSAIAAPLTDLTRSTTAFPSSLPPAALDAFHHLKSVLTSAPVLALPITGPAATFTLYTDASAFAIGAVLLQDQGKGLQPIAFESRKLNSHERNYPVHERELFAVVHAVKHFRCYLDGCAHFTVLTDHDTLKYFFTQKDLSGRQARWSQTLAPYQPIMDLQYRRGSLNQADALSRRPDLFAADPAPLHLLYTHLSMDPTLLHDIKLGYASDPFYTSPTRRLPPFVVAISDGFYYAADRLCVPNIPSLRLRLLHELHDAAYSGHPGFDRTLATARRLYWWPHMSRTIKSYVRACPTCQRIKPSSQRTPGLLQPHSIPSRPWTHVALDLVTALPTSNGFDAVASFTDMFTKQAHFIPTKTTVSAAQLAKLFITWIYRIHGIPRVLVSDRDSRFVSPFWRSLFNTLGTKLNISTAYHPETDGQSERSHRTIEQIVRAYTHPLHDDWSQLLPVAEFAFNDHINQSTGVSPFYANYGYNPDTPLTVSTALPANPTSRHYLEQIRSVHELVTSNLTMAKATQEAYANRTRRPLSFTVGDHVKLETSHLRLSEQPSSKFRDRFIGPFTISEVVSPVAYRLSLPSSMSRVHPVFHVSKLLPWHADTEHPAHPPDPRPLPVATDAQPLVDHSPSIESIHDVRLSTSRRPQLEFLVRYAAPYNSEEHDSWELKRKVQHSAAFQSFIASPVCQNFVATPAYIAFAQKNRMPAWFRVS